MKLFHTFRDATHYVGECVRLGSLVHTEKWQGLEIQEKPEMATYEALHVSFQVPVYTTDLAALRADVGPNLPWADDAFEERVCGHPLNPGEQWKKWPWARSAERFVDKVFDHTYAERYWPQHAGQFADGVLPAGGIHVKANEGIRFAYGDLADVVLLLGEQPLTRQAFMPVWFPEDTGVAHGGRVPCTLGYHFIVRDQQMHVTYYIRSCDYKRHFRDDVYMTVRLLLWVLEQLRQDDETWNDVRPGLFTMHTTSMHVFKADYKNLFGKEPQV